MTVPNKSVRGIRDRAAPSSTGCVLVSNPVTGHIEFEPRSSFTSPRQAANVAQQTGDANYLPLSGGTLTGPLVNSTYLVLASFTVATLPVAPPIGAIASVSDSTQTFTAGVGTAVVGGGGNRVPVYWDENAAKWLIG